MSYAWTSLVEPQKARPANSWDMKQAERPLMTEEVGKREAPGASRRERRTYHDWMFCDAHPRKYGAMSTPPIGVETWLKDVFGDRAKDLLVFMHPHLKRWCLGERHRDPAMGEEMYQVIWICAEAPETETTGERAGEWAIPSDYKGDRFLECFGQFVGEFKLPTRQDFEEIEQGDRKRYGVDAVSEMFEAREEAPQKEKERLLKDYTEDFLDYYFNLACDEANQRAGSGWHMRSVATVNLFSNPERWYYADRGSYKERMRVGSPRHVAELKARWDALVAEADKTIAEQGMSKPWIKPKTAEERAAILAEFNAERSAQEARASAKVQNQRLVEAITEGA